LGKRLGQILITPADVIENFLRLFPGMERLSPWVFARIPDVAKGLVTVFAKGRTLTQFAEYVKRFERGLGRSLISSTSGLDGTPSADLPQPLEVSSNSSAGKL
jgi:hypothetical protein